MAHVLDKKEIHFNTDFFRKFSKLLSLSCGLHYKSFTIVIYDPILGQAEASLNYDYSFIVLAIVITIVNYTLRS
jgi:hypothetical protein